MHSQKWTERRKALGAAYANLGLNSQNIETKNNLLRQSEEKSMVYICLMVASGLKPVSVKAPNFDAIVSQPIIFTWVTWLARSLTTDALLFQVLLAEWIVIDHEMFYLQFELGPSLAPFIPSCFFRIYYN